MQIKIDINVCRVCLQSGDPSAPLFDDSRDTDYAAKFKLTTQLKATKGDGLPEMLCAKCVTRLKVAHEFRVQAESSELHLRKFIADVNSKFSEVTSSKDQHPNEADADGASDPDDADVQALLGETHQQEHQLAPIETISSSLPTWKSSPTKRKQPAETERIAVKRKSALLAVRNLTSMKKANIQKPEAVSEIVQVHRFVDTSTAWIKEEHANVEEEEEDQQDEEHTEVVEEILEDSPENESRYDDDPLIGDTDEALYFTEHPNTNNGSDDDEDDEMHEEHLEIEHFDIDLPNSALSPSKKRGRRKTRADAPKNEDDNHICQECNKDFSTRTNLLRHMNTHAGDKPYSCEVCGKGFTQNGSLKQHMHIHTGERPFKCEFCTRGFTQAKSLVFHMRRHTGEKPFKCDVCGSQFRQKDGLKRHQAVRHSAEPKSAWSCDTCGKILQSKYSMSIHMRKHLTEPHVITEPCIECGRIFDSASALQAHRRQHLVRPILKCTHAQCAREFSSRDDLAEHEMEHLIGNNEDEEMAGDGEMQCYRCALCPSEFKLESHLKAHVTMEHSDRAKKYFCTKCPKSYAIEKNLLKHIRIHGIKNAIPEMVTDVEDVDTESMVPAEGDDGEFVVGVEQCPYCSIGFISSDALRSHLDRIHPDEKLLDVGGVDDDNDKQFPCKSCDAVFSDGDDLDAHVLTEHDAIASKCDQCDAEFTSQQQLDEHRLEHDLTGK